jgi:hypothetical protein
MNENPEADRRHSDRFPIARGMRYRILDKRSVAESGVGNTVNMSSSGVLFATERVMSPGSRVELSINWPVKLNDKCALRFVARGRVVRSERGTAAIEILEHEFRTQPTAALSPPVAGL